MGLQYRCRDQERQAAVRESASLNGIDYLEVLDQDAPANSPRQRTLLIRFLKTVPDLRRENVRIDRGVRVTPIHVQWAFPALSIPAGLLTVAEQGFFPGLPHPERVLVVRTDSSGDFSTYLLSIVPPATPSGVTKDMDVQLSEVEFSFKVECPSDFDCKPVTVCPPEQLPEPEIDYLAKDYASFRRLMLDRLAVIMPNWKERNPADLGVALIEVLAYVGDHLSYFQDATATEAYLGTARKRISVRRHARLLDYTMHDGCNARAWVCFECKPTGDGTILRKLDQANHGRRTRLLTRCGDQPVVAYDDWPKALGTFRPEVFEPLYDIALYQAHNTIRFYTWDDDLCCLPKGATRATLLDDADAAKRLRLCVGDILVFEEQRGPTTGLEADANRAHRHAVRLTKVAPEAQLQGGGPGRTPGPLMTDRLTNQSIVEIEWHAQDALPFPLCISALVEGQPVADLSIARGNVVLADHGQTIEGELLEPPAPDSVPYRPVLKQSGITFSTDYRDAQARHQAATAAIAQSPRDALPAVVLDENGEEWSPQRDLLNSDRFAREFLVEVDDEGRGHLRFGDDVLGLQPDSGVSLNPTYRVGNGSAGNVGAEAIAHLVPTDDSIAGTDAIARVWNPLPAQGGVDPESLEQVRLYAPQAFRTQERAVTELDYANMAQRHPEVQKAAATIRWTGSWYTVFVTIDRLGGQPVDFDFKREMELFLEQYRMAGYDLEINGPIFVPLDILIFVCIKPGYFRSQVKESLLRIMSNGILPDSTRGFFHPDNFTFGQSLYLSQIYQAVMRVAGVASAEVRRFQRWGKSPNQELANGVLTTGKLEVLRLDNDPNFPENGRLEFDLAGGL